MTTSVCFYFQVHQPYRLRRDFDFFSIGTTESYEDEAINAQMLHQVAEKCYLPANAAMLELIRRHEGKFKVAYSISGVALDQFAAYEPRVIESFKALAKTGCVEFLAETYHHSLAFLVSEREFRSQVKLHRQRIKELFGQDPKTFRNTELIYNDQLAQVVEGMGFRAILAEGADRILGWRSPNYVYRPEGTSGLALLCKNYRLSDDVAFHFSNRAWAEWPLTADKFANWVHQVAGGGEVVNLFMDYETFGEHQWAETGIFDFLKALPEAILAHPDFRFQTPAEVAVTHRAKGELSMPEFVSWAASERDVSAWLGNQMQCAAAEHIYSLEKEVMATRDERLVHEWRKLQTSDHFYYMSTQHHHVGDVRRNVNPYESPYDAFIFHSNAVNQLRHLCSLAPKPRKVQPTETKPLKAVRRPARPTPPQPRSVPSSAPNSAMRSAANI